METTRLLPAAGGSALFFGSRPNRRARVSWLTVVNSVLIALLLVGFALVETMDATGKGGLGRRVRDLQAQVAAHDKRIRELEASLAALQEEEQRMTDEVGEIQKRTEDAVGKVDSSVRYVHERLDNLTTNKDLEDEVNHVRESMKQQKHDLTVELDTREQRIDASLARTQQDFAATVNHTITETHQEMVKYEKAFQNYSDALKADLDAGFKRQKDLLNKFHKQVTAVEQGLDDYVLHTNAQFKVEHSLISDWIAGTFTILGFLISMRHVYSHTSNFNKPAVQRKILAILWMVPVYGVTSWIALVLPARAPPDIKPLLALFRDFYEAYCIYMFMALMVAILGNGNHHRAIQNLPQKLEKPFECCVPTCLWPCVKPQTTAKHFLWQCQLACIQFVVLKPALSLTVFALGHLDMPEPRNWYDLRHYELYVTVILNVSVATAFYGLICFYHAVQKQLALYRPWPKFLCIKGVVFLTFWQNMTITVLLYVGYPGIANAQVGEAIQNFLICVEMFMAAAAHTYTFPYQEWQDGYKLAENTADMADNFAARDFVRDFKWVAFGGSASKQNMELLSLAEPVPVPSPRTMNRTNADEEETKAARAPIRKRSAIGLQPV